MKRSKWPLASTWAAIFVLTGWRLRKTGPLLAITGLGMIAASFVICAIPLLTQTIFRLGLPEATITLHATAGTLSAARMAQIQQQLTQPLQRNLTDWLTVPPTLSLETSSTRVLAPSTSHPYTMSLIGASGEQARPHLTILEGRLPRISADALEVVLHPSVATQLQLRPGATLTLRYLLLVPGTHVGTPATLTLRVVGIFLPAASDPYWQNTTFAYQPDTSLTALTENTALANAIDTLTRSGTMTLPEPIHLYWRYPVVLQRLENTEQLNELLTRYHITGEQLKSSDSSLTEKPPFLQQRELRSAAFGTAGKPGTLSIYRDQLQVVQLPLFVLAVQITALILFFVAIMTELLLEQQDEALALLHSRGATRLQLSGTLLLQVCGPAILALLLGPLLALLAVRSLVQWLFSSHLRLGIDTLLTIAPYSIGLLLGLVVGLFLAFTTLPYLLPAAINYASFTNISTTKEFFSMLNSGAAISVIIPPEIWLPLLALLGISLLVLLLTVSTIIRASLHTVLRLNAD